MSMRIIRYDSIKITIFNNRMRLFNKMKVLLPFLIIGINSGCDLVPKEKIPNSDLILDSQGKIIEGELTRFFDDGKIAAVVNFKDKKLDGKEGDEIKMQGLIAGLDAEAGTFLFNGNLIEIDTLDDEFDVSLIVDGTMMTVEGYIDAEGNFVVEEIQDEKETEDEIEGLVSAVSTDDSTVTVSVTVEGVEMFSTYTVSNSTRMIDEMDGNDKYFNIGELSIGDSVAIEFYTEGDINVATELERDDAETEDAAVEEVVIKADPSTQI